MVAKEKFERMALEKADQEEVAKQAAMQQVSDADFAKYNKVLSRDKITGVQDLEGPYKKVMVSNGELTFSFEVPDKWLVETRNSGEVTMNEGELREFLSTSCFYDEKMKSSYFEQQGIFSSSKESSYTGFFQEKFKKITFEEMLTLYKDKKDKFSVGFPNASISDGCVIYSGLNGGQIDFYLLSEQDSKRYYDFDVKDMSISSDVSSRGTMSNTTLGSKNALSFIGDKTTEYGFAGTRKIFVPLKNIEKVLVIYQENANYSNIVSNAFEHLINTFSFQ
ncbi:MAG: hypothetical protein IPJ67_01270 [Candidatus Moraniibacteriota bacterium]|nr:MAG: hypothetical protein IPJ67_01270 [Candidatus Moranbacteria bacterium]